MTRSRTALVTGVGGQDGVLLARLLSRTGWRVVGTARPGRGVGAMGVYLDGVEVVEHDVRDVDGFARLLGEHRPAVVHHLAGLSSVAESWDRPQEYREVNAEAVERMLEVLATGEGARSTRFVHASSAEVFGPGDGTAFDEDSPIAPHNPYGESKAQALEAIRRRRRSDDLDACSIIHFNHESPLRGRGFVTRKLTRAAAEVAEGLVDGVELGSLDVRRDWGAAIDHVELCRRLGEHPSPVDVVAASGRAHTLADVVRWAFEAAGVPDPMAHVRHDPALVRPVESPVRLGDPGRARRDLGWSPRHDIATVVAQMVAVDRRRVTSGVEEDPAYVERTVEA